MQKLICLTLMSAVMLVAVAFGADVVPVAAVAPAVVPSFMAWFLASLSAILGILLSISELMSVSPWFKGNGLIDSAIKALTFLIQMKKTEAATGTGSTTVGS